MKIHGYISNAFYLFTSMILTLFSLAMIAAAFWQVVTAFRTEGFVSSILSAIGLMVIAIAVFDVSRFLVEEEILRGQEVRTSRQARGRLTKFITIITLAISLEALVLIFEAGQEHMSLLTYPAMLLLSAIGLVVGLGVYHKLSESSEQSDPSESSRE